MAKKKKAPAGDEVDKKALMKELRAVLKDNGITARISDLSFTSSPSSRCTCKNGKEGVLRIVGGKFVCVCD